MNIAWNDSHFHSKIYGGWLGKNVGGTLGAPLEVCVLPVATRQTKQPGAFYYLTDILFLPVD